jgi:hypothetical protein
MRYDHFSMLPEQAFKPRGGFGMTFEGGSGGGGQPKDTTTTQLMDPAVAPYVTYGLSEAQRIYNQPAPEYFPGQTYVGPSGSTQAALQAAQTRALQGSPLVPQAQSTFGRLQQQYNPATGLYGDIYGRSYTEPSANFYASAREGGFVNPAMAGTQTTAGGAYLGGNPFFQGAFQPAAQAAQQAFTDSVSQLRSGASQAGRYGSDAMANLEDRAMGQLGQSLSNTAGQLAFQNYSSERAAQENALSRLGQLGAQDVSNRFAGAQYLGAAEQQALQNQLAAASGVGQLSQSDLARQLQAASGAPAIAEADYSDIQRLLTTGQAQEGYQQMALQDAINRYNYQQNLPSLQLQQYLSAAYGSPMGGITTSQVPSYTNTGANVLGGALGGYALGGTTGAAAGGLLGAYL